MARRHSASNDAASSGGTRGRARLVVAIAVPLVIAGIALPRFLGSDEVAPTVPQGPLQLIRVAPPPTTPKPPPPPRPRKPPPPPTFPVTQDGDLVLEVSFRWPSFPQGARIPATVRLGNTSPREFHLPAALEPHPTLAVVVLDAEGREVRRVVESSIDPYPRRTVRLAPGGALDVDFRVVDHEDAPLPAGDYTVYAEFRPDPNWARLGLAFWTAPNGPVRSAQEPFTVLPKTE